MMGLRELQRSLLDSDSAAQNVPPKSPVTHQTEPWVFERCRLVVLKEEVPDPGERITLDEPCRNEPPPSGNHGRDEQCDGNARAGEVQSSARPVGVLAEVKGIKIAESPKRVLVVHGDSLMAAGGAIARIGEGDARNRTPGLPRKKYTTCPNTI